MPRQQTLATVLTCIAACAFAVHVEADTCAGHRSAYLGYGVGAPRRAASPFAGTLNPRYANTAHASGPVFVMGPTDYLARQSVYAPQLPSIEQTPESAEQVEFASDIELMNEPAPANESEEPEGVSPDYPGQFAAAETDTAPPRPARPQRSDSRARPARFVGQGAFHAAASPELARVLGHAF